jgi:hypothetical protein
MSHVLDFAKAETKSVHAADGKLKDVEAGAVVNFPTPQFTTWLDMRGNGMLTAGFSSYLLTDSLF